MTLPDIEFQIARLELECGDVLVVKAPHPPSFDVMRHIVPPGVRVLYIPPDVELSVLTKADIEARAQAA